MKILINDHSGHNFTLSLSRQLAKQQFLVHHCFSVNFQSPKGYLEKTIYDSDNLSFNPIRYKKRFRKYSIVARSFQELEYAKALNTIIAKEKPDIVICANTPLIAQQKILLFCKRKDIPFIYWCQDLYGIAIRKIALKKLGVCGKFVSFPFEFLEKYQLKKASAIIVITKDFEQQFFDWKIKTKTIIIPNWSAIDDIKIGTKSNTFSKKYDLEKTYNLLYSGTLGLKHNPNLIIEVCKNLSNKNNIKVVVVSEGIGADFLIKEKKRLNLNNLILIPFQPFDVFSDVLSSADVFFALLEQDAGLYSVPSKILSYLCAGKPVLISAPKENLASQIIISSNAGIWIDNTNNKGIADSVITLSTNHELHDLYSQNARNYAEQNFKISDIALKFISLINEIIQK